jgi:hypothetical protein
MNHEGATTELVEQQTSKIPSLAFMGFAIAAMGASAFLLLTGRKQIANFVGQWAPTILIMGLYNKVTKEIANPQRRGQQLAQGYAGGASPYTAGANAGDTRAGM